MLIVSTAIILASFVPQSADEPHESNLAVISARLGDCSADFTVKDQEGKPVYAAIIHVRIRYGFLSLKRMDLEVGTDSDGKARVEGLPTKAKPLTYEVSRRDRKAAVEQDLANACHESYEVSLK